MAIVANAESIRRGEIRPGLGLSINRIDIAQKPLNNPSKRPESHWSVLFNIKGGLTSDIVGDVSLLYSRYQFARRVGQGGVETETGDRIRIPVLMRYLALILFFGGCRVLCFLPRWQC